MPTIITVTISHWMFSGCVVSVMLMNTLGHDPASSFTIKSSPPIQDIETARKSIRINIVSLDIAHGQPKLIAGFPLCHDDAPGRQDHISHAKREAALMEAQALRRRDT